MRGRATCATRAWRASTASGSGTHGRLRDYNAGLIAEQLGNVAEARRRLKSAYDADKKTLRFTDAYAVSWRRMETPTAQRACMGDFSKLAPLAHLVVERALADLDAGRIPDAVSALRRTAAAESYGLGAAGSREGDDFALIYLRLSLRPSTILTAVTLASVFLKQTIRRSRARCRSHVAVPGSTNIRPRLLDGEGKSDEAIGGMTEIVAARPNNIEAFGSSASLQRAAKKYAEAAATLAKAIAAVGVPQRENWTLFYFRGICYERDKQWPKAERRGTSRGAEELYPDQPLVLNYLGYSWVDQADISKRLCSAPRGRVAANDGYIVDSLGWARSSSDNIPRRPRALERPSS